MPDDPFAAVLSRLFAPLADAMVARGVTLQAANDALKQALLNAALTSEGADSSDSRISLRTGLHRKDVKRLRSLPADNAPVRSLNAVAMVVSYWATAPEYQGPDGNPRDLARDSDDNGPGVYDLVRRTRADMAPGTVLAVMLDQGVVRETPDGRFQLQSNAFLPDAGSAALVAAYEATLSAHLRAATHNLLAPNGAPRHFDRVVRYSHLTPQSVEMLSAMAAERAQAALKDINTMAREMQEKDSAAGATGRFAFGAYVLPDPGKEEQK